MLNLTLVFVAVVLLAVVAQSSGRKNGTSVLVRALDSRAFLAVVVLVSFFVLWYAWAAKQPLPRVQDEMAYVLQAEIFAKGQWALDSPPIPAFWEQPHVLVEPVLASKYFPGHSLLLSLGASAGWLPLMPLLLGALSAGLLYLLAKQVANGAVALLAWSTWLFMPMVLYFGPSYYSESTTTFCWLAGWYSLLRWRSTHSAGWLVAIALFTGWCAITRPLTAVAYAVPLGIVVVTDIARTARWRQLALAFAVGCLVLSILPLWSARTSGHVTVTPHKVYTSQYMPYDRMGFGLDDTPPSRDLTPQMAQLNRQFESAHARHVPSDLFAIFLERADHLSAGVWGASARVLLVFALLGLITLNGSTAFAVVTSIGLVLAYLLFAAPAGWTLYHYETSPAFAYVTAAGVAWAASLIGKPRGAPNDSSFRWRSTRWTNSIVAASGVLILSGLITLRVTRAQHVVDRRHLERFARDVEAIPRTPAILFVRYSPTHSAHVTFVRNTSNPTQERVWVVYDRGGAENARLLALAPNRTAYLYDESVERLAPYAPR